MLFFCVALFSCFCCLFILHLYLHLVGIHPISLRLLLYVRYTCTNFYRKKKKKKRRKKKLCVIFGWVWAHQVHKFLELVKLSIVITFCIICLSKVGTFCIQLRNGSHSPHSQLCNVCSWWWHWALVSPCFNFQLMASNSKIFTVIFSGDCLPWWTNRAQLRM